MLGASPGRRPYVLTSNTAVVTATGISPAPAAAHRRPTAKCAPSPSASSGCAFTLMSLPITVAIVPGNGAGDVEDCNWYGWLRDQLRARWPEAQVHVELRNMPDPVRARESVWLPFMAKQLGCGEHSIIVGHSSGAAAAMRFAETRKVLGVVLVGAYVSDLGDHNEAESGYFNRPWQWESIKQNSQFIIQFASRDDPFLPWDEQQLVADSLGADLRAYTGRGHFQDEEQPELLEAVEAGLRGALRGGGGGGGGDGDGAGDGAGAPQSV